MPRPRLNAKRRSNSKLMHFDLHPTSLPTSIPGCTVHHPEDGGSDQPRLRPVLEPPPQHLQLGHLVRVELQQLKEVEEELGNEKLFSSQL